MNDASITECSVVRRSVHKLDYGHKQATAIPRVAGVSEAGDCGGNVAAGLATEGVLHRADAIDADLRILGLAVPQPPAQALDLLDDHRLCGRALRTLVSLRCGPPFRNATG